MRKTALTLALILGSMTCANAATSPSGHAAPGDWPTYHKDNSRSGNATDLAPLSTLSTAWHTKLDGAVYGQPLVVGNQLLAATEHDTVYSLDPATGAVQWSKNVGTPVPLSDLPCGNIDPLGITSTMAYDQNSGRVFALAETTGGQHTLVGINVATGAVEVRVGVEPPQGDPIAHQQRSALTVLNDRVYIAYGGLWGDCSNYIGSVVSVTTSGTNPLSYAIPTTREGGIWAPGGAVVDGARLLYSVGNGESSSGYDGSDSVIALSAADLSRTDYFAPSTWADDNARDLDLGSSSPVLTGQYVTITGKRGITYVLRHDKLGHIGGQIKTLSASKSFGGASVAGSTTYMPCRTGGLKALTIGSDGTPKVQWTGKATAAGSPTIGGGAVWVVDYAGGVLYALDQTTGAVRSQLQIGTAPHFASPTLSGSRAYVGTMDGVVAAHW